MSKHKLIGWLGLIVAFGGMGVASSIEYYLNPSHNGALIVAIGASLITGGILWSGRLDFLRGRGSYNQDLKEVKEHFQPEEVKDERPIEVTGPAQMIVKQLLHKFGNPVEIRGNMEFLAVTPSQIRVVNDEIRAAVKNGVVASEILVEFSGAVMEQVVAWYWRDALSDELIKAAIRDVNPESKSTEERATRIIRETKEKHGAPRYFSTTSQFDESKIKNVNAFVLDKVREYFPELLKDTSPEIGNDMQVGMAHGIVSEYWGQHIPSVKLEEVRQDIFSYLSPEQEPEVHEKVEQDKPIQDISSLMNGGTLKLGSIDPLVDVRAREEKALKDRYVAISRELYDLIQERLQSPVNASTEIYETAVRKFHEFAIATTHEPDEAAIAERVKTNAVMFSNTYDFQYQEKYGLPLGEQMLKDRKETDELVGNLNKLADDIRKEGLPEGWYYDKSGRIRNEKGRYAKLPEVKKTKKAKKK